MLVICEDCAKKYDIDETRIKSDKAQFSCKECGHIIVVEKQKAKPVEKSSAVAPEPPSVEKKSISDEEIMAQVAEELDKEQATAGSLANQRSGRRGTPVSVYIMMTMLTGFLLISAAFAYLYLAFIPQIINNQIDLRTLAITRAFSGIVKKPIVLRHYLQVNKEAQRISKIPGVAYTAVINKKGIIIAGFFSNLNKFDQAFAQQFKEKGFPKDVVDQNKLYPGTNEQSLRLVVGGQKIVDQAVFIPETGSEIHVGVYVSEVDDAIRHALLSPLTLSVVGGVIVVGIIMIILLSTLIARPLRNLTNIANRISLGQLELAITSKGPREMRDLAAAFERMRVSVKSALDRLKK
jgi:methyl-accepting chemotaxis protein